MMETPLINPTSIGRLLFQDVFVGTPKWFRVRRLNCTNLAIWRAMPSEAIHQEIVDELGGCHNGVSSLLAQACTSPKKQEISVNWEIAALVNASKFLNGVTAGAKAIA